MSARGATGGIRSARIEGTTGIFSLPTPRSITPSSGDSTGLHSYHNPHTLTHSLTNTHTLSHTHTYTLTHTVTHTVTHTHTHTHMFQSELCANAPLHTYEHTQVHEVRVHCACYTRRCTCDGGACVMCTCICACVRARVRA